MKSGILAGALLLGSVAQAQVCNLEKVSTPNIFLNHEQVDKNAGTLSFKLPSCKTLSFGFLKHGRHDILYSRTSDESVDETFGSPRSESIFERWSEGRLMFKSYHFLPDGILLYAWLAYPNSAGALFPVEFVFVKFNLDGELDTNAYRGRGIGHFNNYGRPDVGRMFLAYAVNRIKINENTLDIHFYYEYDSWNPQYFDMSIGYKLPKLENSFTAIPPKCPQLAGQYTGTKGRKYVVATDGCSKLKIDYDATETSYRDKFKVKEEMAWETRGGWVNTKTLGWTQAHWGEEGFYFDWFNEQFLLDTLKAKIFKAKKEDVACGYQLTKGQTYIEWIRGSDGICHDVWRRNP